MEDMGSVDVDVDAFGLFRVHIAGNMVATIDDQAGFASPTRSIGEYGTRQACTDDKVIVLRHGYPFVFGGAQAPMSPLIVPQFP